MILSNDLMLNLTKVRIAYTTGSGKLICNALPRREDNVVIFTEEGYIQDAKYGSIWQKG